MISLGDGVMNLKETIVSRVNSVSGPLGEAMKAAQELMAPQMDAGTKGVIVKPAAGQSGRRRPHY
jgi:hypothetical protein